MTNRTDAYDRVNRQLNLGMRLLGLWLALVSLFFLREALDYRGLVARLAEWQFLHFDRYWPTLTFTLLTLICALPLIVPLWIVRARQRRDERYGPARIDDRRILMGRAARLQNFFGGIAAGSVIAAAMSLVMMMQLPSDRKPAESIVIGSLDAVAPEPGPAVLTGWVNLAETAQFNENLLLVKRTLYFAPIRSGPRDKSPLRYFVEVERTDIKDGYHGIRFPEGDNKVHAWRYRIKDIGFTPLLHGVLRRGALPGEIANLYRYVGHKVDKDNYVLFRSNQPIAWRFKVIAGEFTLAALIAALVAIWFARQRRRIARDLRDEDRHEMPAPTEA